MNLPHTNRRLAGLASLALLTACAPEIDGPGTGRGQADFSRYLAAGDGFTAGFADGGLYRESQQASFPNLLAQQLRGAGGGAFAQPLFSEAQANGTGYLALRKLVTGSGTTLVLTNVTDRLAVRETTPSGLRLYTKYPEQVQNLGLPELRVADLPVPLQAPQAPDLPFYPFLERLVPETSPNTSYLDLVGKQNPTFFTLWLGSNDVLGHALSGGTGLPLTEVATFSARYNQLLDTLTRQQAKGVVATIPDITALPFFTTLTLGNFYETANLQGSRVYLKTGAGIVRQATAGDLPLLSAQAAAGRRDTIPASVGPPIIIPHGTDPRNPLEDHEVLDKEEATAVTARTAAFNQIITAAAAARGLPVADMNAFLNDFASQGLSLNGLTYSTTFISGEVYSLDGVHFTPRGYALLANKFIDVINAAYGASVPQLNFTNYPGTRYPR